LTAQVHIAFRVLEHNPSLGGLHYGSELYQFRLLGKVVYDILQPESGISGRDSHDLWGNAESTVLLDDSSISQPSSTQTIALGGVSHYSHHQQPPLLQPKPAHDSVVQSSYVQCGNYANGFTSPQQAGHRITGPMGAQGNVLSLPLMSPTAQPVIPGQGYASQQGFDTTGQLAPPGMKPRVTATLWEDEGSLCFQVEAKGVCVARREGVMMSLGEQLPTCGLHSRYRR
jgi:enhanced filamentous growth protein 1